MKSFNSGKGSEAQEFFETFEHLASLHDLSDKEMAMTFAELITGPEVKVYNALEGNKRHSYKKLKAVMLKKFAQKENPLIARKKYNNRRQSQKWTVQELFDDLCTLAPEAHPNYTSAELYADILDHFVDASKPDFKQLLLCNGVPENLDDCLEKAKNIETAHCDEKSSFLSVNAVKRTQSTYYSGNNETEEKSAKTL